MDAIDMLQLGTIHQQNEFFYDFQLTSLKKKETHKMCLTNVNSEF